MSNTKRKTALMKVIEWTKKSFDCNHDIKAHAFLTMLEKSLPEERQNIVDAYIDGIDKQARGMVKHPIGKQYFNETYETT